MAHVEMVEIFRKFFCPVSESNYSQVHMQAQRDRFAVDRDWSQPGSCPGGRLLCIRPIIYQGNVLKKCRWPQQSDLGSTTVWGTVQAFTSVARCFNHPDPKLDLEQRAGMVLRHTA